MLSRRESFAVHTYEVDAFGTLAVPALSGYLSEVAGLHAGELGVGLDALMARGLTWVLVRQRIENPVPVRLGDTIEIETWPSGIDRLAAVREFVVRRGDEEVARATTQWFVLDVATRKPVRPGEVLDARFPREARPPAIPLSHGKLPDLRARLADLPDGDDSAAAAIASRQSRLTVSGETPSAAAISSSVKPPKKRISTTRLCRDVPTATVAGRGSSASILVLACRNPDGQVT